MVPLHEILQLSMICWPLRRGLMTSSESAAVVVVTLFWFVFSPF